MKNEIVLKRLAIIKHLFRIGVEQSYQVETVAAFSILSFHDSIEMYLKLLAEEKNIKSDKLNFLDYWTQIPSLTLKESMRNLNARRVNIKHKGLLPSKSDIEISRVNAHDFFDQNTKTQFGIEFSEISLFSLISYENVRSQLEEAEKALNGNNFEDSIEKAAIAFHELLYTYENSKSDYLSNSPFFFGKDLTFQSSFHMGIREDRDMARFVDNVRDSLDGIQKAIKIISFGIDYKRFAKFKLLTPKVTRMQNGHHVSEIWRKKKWTKQNCQFCIDFVLDSALKLQEFDFDIAEIEEPRTFEPVFVEKESKAGKKAGNK
ncbi:MAG: hypothetical protein ACMVP2_03710 [Imperialibacter sp.]|uniref:hypothetical protein n=1 Tax=Imperialibacter sp. TaxID=2038411 RepID=UPI003A873BA0